MGSFCLPLRIRIQHILVDGKSSQFLRRPSFHSFGTIKVMYSPLEYPFDASTFNFAILIIGYVTSFGSLMHSQSHTYSRSSVSIFGIISWWIIPADKWLRPELIAAMRKHAFDEKATHAME